MNGIEPPLRVARQPGPQAYSGYMEHGVRFELTNNWFAISHIRPLCHPCIKFGTLPRSRTERTLPFERSDFARFVQQGIVWRKAEESNPIPVKRTWFSRPVAGPSPLHYFPFTILYQHFDPYLCKSQVYLDVCMSHIHNRS
jgi:hypothetical protein